MSVNGLSEAEFERESADHASDIGKMNIPRCRESRKKRNLFFIRPGPKAQ